MIQVHQGHVLDVLARMDAGSVQCCVTSSPYWGLRTYPECEVVWGGADADCEHVWGEVQKRPHETRTNKDFNQRSGNASGDRQQEKGGRKGGASGRFCQRCGAWFGELGLEPTIDLYLEHMVSVMRGVRRVLRDDGCCWLNIGDSYAANRSYQVRDNKHCDVGNETGMSVPAGLKPKDLCMIPARLALALQADGWWIRSQVVWAKGVSFCPTYAGSVMPESVTDRPVSAYELVYLLTKEARYYYDAEAVREVGSIPAGTMAAKGSAERKGAKGVNARPPEYAEYTGMRHLRNVWTINPQPSKKAHYASFPEALVEPCVKAGSSPRACELCGAPWERVVETTRTFESGSGKAGNIPSGKHPDGCQGGGDTQDVRRGPCLHTRTTGWRPTCEHADDPGKAQCVVLDPFCGTGTVGYVCNRLGRSFVGIELSPEYVKMCRQRLAQPQTREMFT